MNNRIEEHDINSLFGASATRIPSMQKRSRTKAEKDKIESNKTRIFSIMWVFLAATTFMFGFNNLSQLFISMFEWLPFQPITIERIAAWGGGVMALVFLDGGYPAWGYLKLNSSETNGQYKVAEWAEDVAFYSSLYFTGAVILGLFSGLIPPVLIWMLGIGGACIFVFATLNSMVCMFYFIKWSQSALQMAHDARTESEQATEILAIYQETEAAATSKIRGLIQADVEKIGEEMAEQMKDQIKREMKKKIGRKPNSGPAPVKK